MKLPWQKEEKAPSQLAKARAAVVPKSYKFQIARGVTENNFTVNSYSTVITTVQVLKPGETAESVAIWQPGTINFGVERHSVAEVEAQGQYQVQFDAPNWVGVIISQHGGEYIEHVELPVWVDPVSGRVHGVDVPELIQQLEPRREQLSRHWGKVDGPFADIHQLISLPKDIVKAGKFFASLPGEWVGAVKDLFADEKARKVPPAPLPPEEMPDLSQYSLVGGIGFYAWVQMCVKFEKIAELGFTHPEYLVADKEWRARMNADPKLKAYFSIELQRLNLIFNG